MFRTIFCAIVSFFLFLAAFAQTKNATYIFQNRKEGYRVYRIPTIVCTPNGKLLAFCEGRQSLRDKGNIDLVLKTSSDSGRTWGSLKVLWNDGKHTCGNPTPVVDATSGEILLLATHDNERVFILRSKNEGESWSPPEDITVSLKDSMWKWYATGPVHAIQLQTGPNKDRLVIPCNHTGIDNPKHVSHVIYSDDHGKSWKTGGSVPDVNTDECTVAELSDGNLLLNIRSNDRTLPNRKQSFSHDGGLSWTAPEYDTTLIEPLCQGALLRYRYSPNILLFSNPNHTKRRKNLQIAISKDDAHSWKKTISVNTGKSAYSDMVKLPDNDLLILYETGKILPYSGIAYKIIPSKKITSIP